MNTQIIQIISKKISQSLQQSTFSNRSMFLQLLKLFNLQSKSQKDQQSIQLRLIYSISKIFNIHRQKYLDFLQFHKQHLLRKQTYQSLCGLFQNIWQQIDSNINKKQIDLNINKNQFKNDIVEKQFKNDIVEKQFKNDIVEKQFKNDIVEKQLLQLIPKFNNIQQIQTHHINIFNYYKQQRLYDKYKNYHNIGQKQYDKSQQLIRKQKQKQKGQQQIIKYSQILNQSQLNPQQNILNQSQFIQPALPYQQHQHQSNNIFHQKDMILNHEVNRKQIPRNLYIKNNQNQNQNSQFLNKNMINNNNSNNFISQNEYLNYIRNANGNVNVNINNININKDNINVKSKEEIIKVQNQMDIQYSQINIINLNNHNSQQNNQFKHCICKGLLSNIDQNNQQQKLQLKQQSQKQQKPQKQQQQSQIMTCTSCSRKYHYKCLKISKQYKYSYKKCPSCKLQQSSNIFKRINPYPLINKWHKIQQNNIFLLSFTQQQIQNIKYLTRKYKNILNEVQFHLKFLKIQQRNSNNNNRKHQQKQQKPQKKQKIQLPQLQQPPQQQINQPLSQQSPLSQPNILKQQPLIKIQPTNTFNTIILPIDYMLNIQNNNYFQIILKQQQNKNNNIEQQSFGKQQKQQKQQYFFIAIYLVQKVNPETLAKQLFNNLNQSNSVNEQYLKKFFQSQIQQQSSNLQPTPTNQPPNPFHLIPQFLQIPLTIFRFPHSPLPYTISTPIRGNNCNHYQVFDYLITLKLKQQQIKQNNQNNNRNNKQRNQLKQIKCPICGKICEEIIVDRFLYEVIQKKRIQRGTVRYYKNGNVEWVDGNVNTGINNMNHINHINHNNHTNHTNHTNINLPPHPNHLPPFPDYQNILPSMNNYNSLQSSSQINQIISN